MLKDKTKEELISIIENMPTINNTKAINNLIYDIERHIECQQIMLNRLKDLVNYLSKSNSATEVLASFILYGDTCCQDTFCQEVSLLVTSYLENDLIK